VTIALMPLTYSIAYGIIAGLFTWVVIKLADMALDAIFQKVESKDEPQSYYVGQPGMLQPVADGQMPVMMSMPVADPSQPFSVAPVHYTLHPEMIFLIFFRASPFVILSEVTWPSVIDMLALRR